MADIPNESLPHLLYMGDVAVEETYHGSILLYRLLQDYPKEKLRIIERGPQLSKEERRLPQVTYKAFRNPLERPVYSRFNAIYRPIYDRIQTQEYRWINHLTNAFPTDAVISVHHGWGWITAYQYARKHQLPYYLICHDTEMSSDTSLAKRFSIEAYQYARQRFCVSPQMQEEYRQRYGAEGILLYPGRAKHPLTFDEPPDQLKQPVVQPTLVYGGNLFHSGYYDLIRMTAEVLAEMGGRIILYGPHSEQTLRDRMLDLPNVELGGMLPSNQMIQDIREKGHCIYIPMSFDDDIKDNMQFSFPSKIVDSTLAGLPLFVHGPSYCSAVKWAKKYNGVGIICESPDKDSVRAELSRLFYSPEKLLTCARNALKVGRELFDYSVIQQIFFKELQNGICH